LPKPIESPEVAAVFERYPSKIRQKALALRALILETAAATEGVGPLEVSADVPLRWKPAHLAPPSRRHRVRRAAPLELASRCRYGLSLPKRHIEKYWEPPP
jgi:hypothetical protein